MSNEIEIKVKSKYDKTGSDQAKKGLKEVGDSAQRVGDVAKGVIASQVFDRMGQAAVAGIKSTFTAAKDLGESVNAVNVSFGQSADQILKWGEQNAASFGLSQRAFNQAVVPMGSILKNTGMDMGTVSDSTIALTERAADMASVFNVDVSEALDALQAGLRGESDPLEKFGVGLNAAAVEAKAMADTGKENAKQLTDQEKMLARVAIIMEQTSQVQGDFANTSGDAANAQRIATAEMEDAKAVMGQAFLPIAAAVAKVVAFLARGFSELPGPLQAVVAIVGVLGAAFVFLAPKLIAAKAAIDSMGVSASRTSKLMLGMLGPIGLLIAGGQALGEVFADELDSSELKAMDEQLTELFKKDPGKAAAKFKQWAEMLDMAGMSADDLAALLPDYAAAQAEAEAATKDSADAQGDFADKTKGAAEDLESARQALDEYMAAQRAAVDPVLGLMDALQSVDDAQSGFNDAVDEFGKDSPEARKAARELASAVLGAEGAASDADLSFDDFDRKLKQWVKQGKISKETADVLRDGIKGARGQADKFGGTRVAKLKAQIDRAGLNQAEASLNQVARDRIAKIIAQAVGNIGSLWGGAHGGIAPASHAAEGGPRGNTVLVGEQGPELVDLAPGSMVHPAGTTRNMLASGGEQRVILELRSSGSRVDDLLLEILRHAIRVRGGDVEAVLGR